MERHEALEIIRRMTGCRHLPQMANKRLKETLAALQSKNPYRMEFEVMRTQGRAWDHEEVPQTNGDKA